MKTIISTTTAIILIASLLVFSGCEINSPTSSNNDYQPENSQVYGFKGVADVDRLAMTSSVTTTQSYVIQAGTAHNQACLDAKFKSYEEAVWAYYNGNLVIEVWLDYFQSLGVPAPDTLPPLPDFKTIDTDSGYALFLQQSTTISSGLVQRIGSVYSMYQADQSDLEIREALEEMRIYAESSPNAHDREVTAIFWGSFQLNCIGWQGQPPTGRESNLWHDVIGVLPYYGTVSIGAVWSIVANILFGW